MIEILGTELPLALLAVVFMASLVQAVTGIGFGVIAGPILLATMGSHIAIQLSIVLSLLIAIVLAPATLPQVNWNLLRRLFIGVLLGTPVGAVAYAVLSIETLKVLAAVIVVGMTIIATGVLARYPVFEKDSPPRRIIAGMVCGALNATLAMPGPPIAAYATAIRSDKQTIRATTLVTFLFAYPIAFVPQVAISGLGHELVSSAAVLAVPCLLGTLSGAHIAPILGQAVFRWITILFLLASAAALLFF